MILICPYEIKEKYLENSKIHNYKFYTLEEIKEKIFFKFSPLALYKVTSKYGLKPTIAFRMFENLYYINQEYNNSKLRKLFDLKKYLINNNLIIKDDNFLKFLTDEILVEGYPKTKELTKIIDFLANYTKVTYKELKPKYELKEIYKFENIDLEVNFVAESILKLIDSKVDINNIYIINSNSDYISKISRIFSLFGIPFKFNHKKKITMFKITKDFLNFIKSSDLKVRELNEFLDTLKGKNDFILEKIIGVLNKYYSLDEPVKSLYEIIYFDLKRISLKDEKYKNVINIFDTIKSFKDDDFVFAISNNETLKYKDNDYLSDSEKRLIGLDTSYELNSIDDADILNKYENIKNLILSYKLHNNDDEYNINHLFENLDIKEYEFENNSQKYNDYLFANYKMYDNSYKKVDFIDLKNYLDGKLNLSYSSMDQFFKCKFRFYLNNILKIEPYEETMAIKIGNMFHKILERTLKNDYQNYLEIIDEETNNFLSSNIKERFYASKLKKEAIKIIERLKDNNEKSDFRNFEFEKYFEIPLNSKMNIKLVGFIDKILIFNDGINNYIIVIDYKTGAYSVDLSKVKDGFSMQLLLYLYLITKSNIKNPKVAGAYIDHILDELKTSEYGKKYEDIVDDRLDGLTIRNHEILKHIDQFYDVKSYLKGIRVKNDGDFYSNSRVYSEHDFTLLLDLVEKNIKEVIKSIETCSFEINPKRYLGTSPDEVEGCSYCPFKEVCYMTASNIKLLKKANLDEILGDTNELDN